MKNPALDPRYDPPGSLSDQQRIARVVAQTAVEAAFSDIRANGPLLTERRERFTLRLDWAFATVIGFVGGFAACHWFWQ